MAKVDENSKNKKPKKENDTVIKQLKKENKKESNKKVVSFSFDNSIKLEIICIIVICISIVLIISIFFNSGGILGDFISSFLKGLFGIGAYILPVACILFSIFMFFSIEKKINILKFILAIIAFNVLITFFHIITKDKNAVFTNYFQYLLNEYKTANLFDGGIIGAILGDLSLKSFGYVSSYVVLIITFVATIIFILGKSFLGVVKDNAFRLYNYFYEYFSNKEYENELDEEELGQDIEKKENIFSILKDKIKAKINKTETYIEDIQELQEDLQEEMPIEIKEYTSQPTNKRILKKRKDFIYDGDDTYIKIEKPTFFSLNEIGNKADGKIILAIDIINKSKNESKQDIRRNEIPNFFNSEFIKSKKNSYQPEEVQTNFENKFKKEGNVSDFSMYNYSYKSEVEDIAITPESSEVVEENIKENVIDVNNNTINIFKDQIISEKIRNRVFKKEDFLNSGQTIYTIDFDIPSRKEIDEIFSIPPEVELSDEIDFNPLKKLDEFYDFEANLDNVFENTIDVEINSIQDEQIQYFEEIEGTNCFEEFKEMEVTSQQSNKETKDEEISSIVNSYNEHQIAHKQEYTEISQDLKDNQSEKVTHSEIHNTSSSNISSNTIENINKADIVQNISDKEKNISEDIRSEPVIIKAKEEKLFNQSILQEKQEYKFPHLSFLHKNTNVGDKDDEYELELKENSEILIKTLKSFNITAEVINISKGPSVTRYEISIEDGIKVSKILGLSDNLALSLAANTIRIEAPIPGKSAVGIEIPNQEVTSVFLSEVVCSEKFQKFPSKVSFGIGKDITGNVIVTDIAKMPHMLIAGATGSGKSVCINTLITSILYKASPEEVRLIMVDPKVVELNVYNGIPHLLMPVVTEPEKASGVLNWAVGEMMDRYNLFAETGTRNLVGYNQIKEEKGEEKLPQIVIIIDELADLMMVASKEVESSICRLAQLARAAGMHLIIATQRPSVDVITGLIKANVPSRIAFAVSSGTDSRTVIDSVGAEKLLGKGDMLFKSVDMSKPLRIQGAFISEKEVEQIVTYIKENNPARYDEGIINKIEKATKSNDDTSSSSSETDELIEEVISFLVRKGKASTSMVQRQFRIGYNRAARIIEELEDRGIISSENGSKQRDVLMDKYQYEEYLNRYENY